jgi:formylglycine-generating enzyme required for sulfatase activity
MSRQKYLRTNFSKIIVLGLCVLMLRTGLPTQTANNNYEGTFNWAKRLYMEGKYNNARKKLELLLTFLDPEAIEKQDIAASESSRQLLGKIRLLLGAVHEKMGKKTAAVNFYKMAKTASQQLTAAGKPGVVIEELDVNALPGCQEHFLERETIVTSQSVYDAGRIEKEAYKPKKKKKVSPFLIVAGAFVVAAIFAFFLLKKKKKQDEHDPNYDSRELQILWQFIAGGPFMMGSDSPDAEPDEQPMHEVHLNSYYISRYEITFDQFQVYLDDMGRNYTPPDSGWGRGNRPVINVAYREAEDFCTWLSGKTGKDIRLPTEAQWEKAASGSDPATLLPSIYPWGNSPHDCTRANWCCESLTTQVGLYPQGVSYYRIYDMAGNVAEWCRDWYSRDYYAVSELVDPSGPDPSATGSIFSYRVVRGGSWECSAQPGIRIADRGFQEASQNRSYSSNDLGFRIVWIPR